MNEEGAALWEMGYVCEMEICKRFMFERTRPRNYSKHGLRRIFDVQTKANAFS